MLVTQPASRFSERLLLVRRNAPADFLQLIARNFLLTVGTLLAGDVEMWFGRNLWSSRLRGHNYLVPAKPE
jgi:hypothetical protein